jgi:hypothetical protein
MPRETALAFVDQADAAVRSGDMVSAQALHERATITADRAQADARLSARLSEVAGWIAWGQGDATRAKAAFLEATRVAPAAFEPHDAKGMRPLQGLIYAETQMQDFDAALRHQADLEAMAGRIVGKDPNEWAVLDEGRSRILYQAGRFAQGLPQAANALARCEAANLRGDEYCRRLRIQRMRFLLRVGSAEHVIADQRFVESLLVDANAGFLQADALSILLRIESMRGPSELQRQLRTRLEALCGDESGTPLNPTVKVAAMLGLAEDRLRAGALAETQAWLARAHATQVLSGEGAPQMLVAVSRLLAGIAQLHQAQTSPALESITAAHQIVVAAMGLEHPMARLFSLDLAIALHSAGRTDEAIRLAVQAENTLRESLGPSSETFRRVQKLKEALARRGQGGRPTVTGQAREVSPHTPGVLATLDFFT